jgi:alpha-1,3-rhamnosyltransferase
MINSIKISILIPSYNHEKFIEEAVKSVWLQDYDNLELIVVDDGSEDGSKEILEKLKNISPITMKLVRQRNAGICSALNRALEESTGEIIGILASDDIMAPNRLKKEIEYFINEPLLKVMFSNGQFQINEKKFGDAHKEIKPYLKKGISATREHLLTTAPGFYAQARLIRKDFLISIGKFDEETKSDDWSLNIRIFQNLNKEKEFIFIDRVSFYYRNHDNQISKSKFFMTKMKKKVVRKFFNIENRSKSICEEYIKYSILFLLKGKIRKGLRYLIVAYKIGFKKKIPWQCLYNILIKMPSYIFRLIINKELKYKQ